MEYTNDCFTEPEKQLLARYCTNVEGNVFVLKNLPEPVKAALFSRYSRSSKSVKRMLLDEFLALTEPYEGGLSNQKLDVGETSYSELGYHESWASERANQFFERVLANYGDDSVAELAFAHVAIEGVSNLAVKEIEDSRIGLSPLEKSTRYVRFDRLNNGVYPYYVPKELVHNQTYHQACLRLFETYADLFPKVLEVVRQRFPKNEDEPDQAYKSATRARTLDLLRGLLPASTLTNVGFAGNARAFEYLYIKLKASSLSECSDIATQILNELRKVMPAFVKRADTSYGAQYISYFESLNSFISQESRITCDAPSNVQHRADVSLLEYDPEAENMTYVMSLYPWQSCSFEALKDALTDVDPTRLESFFSSIGNFRSNRRHKLPRSFEYPYYVFEITSNFGAYRDLQRHRMMTQQRQLLGCSNGYDFPGLELEPFREQYESALHFAAEAWEKIRLETGDAVAQYVVPFAFKVRWLAKLNFRELVHLVELRSSVQGHPDYRRIVVQMYNLVRKVHPRLCRCVRFVNEDLSSNELERRESESRAYRKIKKLSQGELHRWTSDS